VCYSSAHAGGTAAKLVAMLAYLPVRLPACTPVCLPVSLLFCANVAKTGRATMVDCHYLPCFTTPDSAATFRSSARAVCCAGAPHA
jgi:hypothetical protein